MAQNERSRGLCSCECDLTDVKSVLAAVPTVLDPERILASRRRMPMFSRLPESCSGGLNARIVTQETPGTPMVSMSTEVGVLGSVVFPQMSHTSQRYIELPGISEIHL
jgi:hypothetical protein